jgi:hypothetical protein
MSHFAEIDNDGVVLRVLVAEQDFINSGKVGDSANWIQTSYSGSFRKNYAGKGYSYDSVRDAFIPPKPPYPSWVLDEDTCQWDAPVPLPSARLEGEMYDWDEESLAWVFVHDEEES